MELWIDSPIESARTPDGEGDEHQVWFIEEFRKLHYPDRVEIWSALNRVVKLTHPDFFGLRVVYRQDEDQKCLPCEYFERWVLHNEIFGDDVEILGVVDSPHGLRVAISQQAILGSPASLEMIQGFFLDNGWHRFDANQNIAWFDPNRSLVVSDTHQGNLILTNDGVLVPIDFRIQPLEGAMLEAVKAMVGQRQKAPPRSELDGAE